MGECLITRRGGSIKSFALTVSTSSGATVTVTNNRKTYTQTTNTAGNAIFGKITKGVWEITAEKGSLTATETVDVQEDKIVTIVLNTIPEFTYKNSSGGNAKYKIYNANGVNITSNPETQGDWKIEFLESGNLTFNRLNGAADGIDVFCVGGGGSGGSGNYYQGDTVEEWNFVGAGGGGGGGYTNTKLGLTVDTEAYNITVGGASGKSIFGNNILVANGGNGGTSGSAWGCGSGGSGGSGGGGGAAAVDTPAGGTNGGNGKSNNGGSGGGGQGRPTKEFGESTGKEYSKGGNGGGYGRNGAPRTATANTGNGGGGGGACIDGNGGHTGVNAFGGPGSSGIVVIRNKR